MDHTLDGIPAVQNDVAQEQAQPECLVGWVDTLLANKGHAEPQAWHRLLKPGMVGFPDQNYQAFEINRAWRNALAETIGKEMLSSEESMDVRYALIDKTAVENWKTSFEQGVLPCILKHNLPLNR